MSGSAHGGWQIAPPPRSSNANLSSWLHVNSQYQKRVWGGMIMKELAIRTFSLAVMLAVIAQPVFAQDSAGSSAIEQSQTQTTDQDQGAPPADSPSIAPTPEASQMGPVDPTAVIAQWGPSPAIGPDADQAVAVRWFREQNAQRARWGVPTATRDPYLDWQAENLLRDKLGQAPLPQPEGLSAPLAARQSPQSDQAVMSQPEFWTVSNDLWQAWLDGIEGEPPAGWSDARPGEPWFTRDNYLQLFKIKKTPQFDRFRLVGVSGRVNVTGGSASALLSGHVDQLEAIAPGAAAAYQPLVYPDNLVAVVGYDPWINSDGSLRP
jgi:hypothetical protein